MSPFRTLFLPLIISLLLSSCSSTRELGSTETSEKGSIYRFAPLGSISDPMLFKAAIGISGDHYSGLFLIKRIPDDSTIRVLLLSELGLNMLDLAYRDDEFEVVSVQEFLNKPPLLKTLQNDFRTLLLDLSTLAAYSVTEKEDEDTELLQFRHRSHKYRFYRQKDLGTFRIERRRGLFRRVDFNIKGTDELDICIEHRAIKLKIDLRQLKQFSDHVD